MGFFSKIFKGVKKFFGGVGKVIKKVFTSFGRFTNKLGIVGQIGMMIAAPYLGGLAIKGLSQLGSGFMAGLGGVAQGQSFLAGAAQVTEKILLTAANIASTGINAVKGVSDAVLGVVTDTARGFGNAMGLETNIPVLNSAAEIIPNEVGNVSNIFKNAATRAGNVKNSFKNLSEIGNIWKPGPYFKDAVTARPSYLAKFKTIGPLTRGGHRPTHGVSATKMIPFKPQSAAGQALENFKYSATTGHDAFTNKTATAAVNTQATDEESLLTRSAKTGVSNFVAQTVMGMPPVEPTGVDIAEATQAGRLEFSGSSGALPSGSPQLLSALSTTIPILPQTPGLGFDHDVFNSSFFATGQTALAYEEYMKQMNKGLDPFGGVGKFA